MSTPGLTFRDRNVLVTGASSGIGRETALAFAAAGANVVLVARRPKALAAVATQARKSGVQALAAAADVTKPAAVTAVFQKAIKRFGSVDIVVNNAGVLIPAEVATMKDADLHSMLDVNLFGALHVMQDAVKAMRKQGRGHIVNVASLAGRRGLSPLGGYCASKFALIGLTEALRTELVGERIHVSMVLPGVVDTPMAAAISQDTEHGGYWPQALNMPPSWVVWSIFLAIRFRLAEVGVPPGSAMLEKLASLAPGATDTLLRWASDAARRVGKPTRASR
ncbi:MAG TPA: SDR family oxidoreductase [Steroidobacteraceae bacterium]|nr:SDR family oxidoreductase [Steroidobacteraceae bacterium]HQR47954.1 SDR family oxidoreductase [Steroidobacteraceae bacterium]